MLSERSELKQVFSLDYFQSKRATIDAYVAANPLQAGLIFFAVYVAVTGLSLPGAAIMTLVGGAVFGLLWGTVLVSFASTLGATLAFLGRLLNNVQRMVAEPVRRPVVSAILPLMETSVRTLLGNAPPRP